MHVLGSNIVTFTARNAWKLSYCSCVQTIKFTHYTCFCVLVTCYWKPPYRGLAVLNSGLQMQHHCLAWDNYDSALYTSVEQLLSQVSRTMWRWTQLITYATYSTLMLMDVALSWHLNYHKFPCNCLSLASGVLLCSYFSIVTKHNNLAKQGTTPGDFYVILCALAKLTILIFE